MTLVSSQVVDGDLFDVMANGSGTPPFSTTSGSMGSSVDDKLGITLLYGYIGRFELEIPLGATIDGVRMTFTSDGEVGSGNKSLRLGFLAQDGTWESDGFNATNYSTKTSVPFSSTVVVSTITHHDGVWQDGAAGVDDSFSISASVGATFSFVDGTLSGDLSATGLVDQLQSFVDGAIAADLLDSVSGTAMPVLFAVGGDTAVNVRQLARAFEHATASSRPVLEVAFTPSGGRIEAAGDVSSVVSARGTVSSVASVRGTVSTVASARSTVVPVVSAQGVVSSVAAARGETS